MGGKLSDLQKEILLLALANKFITSQELLSELWQPQDEREKQTGHASLSRALTRLWQKNFIIYWKTLTRYRTGISLTDAGEVLAQAISADEENEQ